MPQSETAGQHLVANQAGWLWQAASGSRRAAAVCAQRLNTTSFKLLSILTEPGCQRMMHHFHTNTG